MVYKIQSTPIGFGQTTAEAIKALMGLEVEAKIEEGVASVKKTTLVAKLNETRKKIWADFWEKATPDTLQFSL